MATLSRIGRLCYGVGMIVMGTLMIYYRDFPYMMIPAGHSWIPGLVAIAYGSGAMLIFSGTCIVIEKGARPASLLLGGAFVLIFCFYFIPYQLFVSRNNAHFGDWENAAKELTLASGAFVIAGCFSEGSENAILGFLKKLIPFGALVYAITIISYAIDHFLYATGAADYVPEWIPYRLFWAYFAGAALLCSGVAIIIKVKRRLASVLLGTMIFTWFLILHMPRVIVSPSAYLGSEIASAVLALAYSGIAFVIAEQEN